MSLRFFVNVCTGAIEYGKHHLLSRLHYIAILTKALKRLEVALNRDDNKFQISFVSCTNISPNLILMLPCNLNK